MNSQDLREFVDSIRQLAVRVRKLEARPYTGSGGGAATPVLVSEGPDIDIVSLADEYRVGRGGDTILIFNSDGTPVEEFSPTQIGLTAALAAADSGDTVEWPSITITMTSAITVPAGVTLRGRDMIMSILTYAPTINDNSDVMISLGQGSVFENATINYSPTVGTDGGNETYSTCIYLGDDNPCGGIVRNVIMNCNIEFKIWAFEGIGGYPYTVTNQLYPSLENIVINMSGAFTDGTYWIQIGEIYGIRIGYFEDQDSSCTIRNVHVNQYFTCTVDWEFYTYSYTIFSDLKYEITDCTSYIYISKTLTDDVFNEFEAYGFDTEGWYDANNIATMHVRNCYSEILLNGGGSRHFDTSTGCDYSYSAAFWTYSTNMTDCKGIVNWTNAPVHAIAQGIYIETSGVAVGNGPVLDNFTNCHFEAHINNPLYGKKNDTIYYQFHGRYAVGAWIEKDRRVNIYDCVFIGDFDLYLYAAATRAIGPFLYGCTYSRVLDFRYSSSSSAIFQTIESIHYGRTDQAPHDIVDRIVNTHDENVTINGELVYIGVIRYGISGRQRTNVVSFG